MDFVDQPFKQMFWPMLSGVMSGFVAPGKRCGFGTAIAGASWANVAEATAKAKAKTGTMRYLFVIGRPPRENHRIASVSERHDSRTASARSLLADRHAFRAHQRHDNGLLR